MMTNKREFLMNCIAVFMLLTANAAPIKSMLGSCHTEDDSIAVKNPYVTDGLVAMWDGEWNVGFWQHDENAAIWKDLVGTEDLVSTNGAFFGTNFANCAYNENGPAQFIGKTQQVGSSYANDIVIDMVIESNFSKNTNLFRTRNARFWQGLKTRIIFGSARSNTPALQLSSGIQKYHITVDCISIASYVNGLLYTSSGRDSNTFYGNNRIEIGPQNSSYCGGRIYRMCIYNRVLSDDEIMHNHEIDRIRFNLP